jgi:hypothetical protein
MANNDMKHRRLQELGESDFEVVEGQPDIRGWDVRDTQGRKIGEVEELIVDAQQKKVRYMVVDLDDNELDIDDDREVLIPIGLAELHEDDYDVILPNITTAQLTSLPEYDDDDLTDDLERRISTAFGRTGADSLTADTFYQHEHFNDNRLYQRRLPASTSYINENAQGDKGFHLKHRNILSSDQDQQTTGSALSTSSSDETITGFNRTRMHDTKRVEDESAVPVNRTTQDGFENRSITDEDRISGSGLMNPSDSRRNSDSTRDSDTEKRTGL